MINKFDNIIYIADFSQNLKGKEATFSIVQGWVPEWKFSTFDPEIDDDESDFVSELEIDENTRFSYCELADLMGKKVIDFSTIKTINFAEGCTVPRFKLKSLLAKYNLKSIRDSQKADVQFYGPKSFNKIFVESWDECIKKDDLLPRLKKINPTYFTNLAALIKAVEDCPNEWVIVPRWGMDKVLKDHKCLKQADELFRSFKFVYTRENKAFLDRLFDPNSNCYGQDSILREMNIGPVIDEEMFKNLTTMFKSTDTQNAVVAMEVMANCNYEKSIVHLCLLFREHYQESIHNQPTRTHINFKSLISYIGTNLHNIDLDNIVDVLVEKKLTLKSNMDILLSMYQKETQDSINTNNFVISKVQYDESIQKLIIQDTPIETLRPELTLGDL